MRLVDRDQPIKTLPTEGADQSLAKRIGLRCPHWGLEHMPPHGRDRPVDCGGINAVPIVEDEPVGRLGADDRAKLLDRPLRRRMLRHVPVEDLTRADVEDDENMEDAEAAPSRPWRNHRRRSRAHDSAQTSPTAEIAARGPAAPAFGDTVPPCGVTPSARVSDAVRSQSVPHPRWDSPGPCS